MRPIGIDELSILVEAAQCAPDECVMIDSLWPGGRMYRDLIDPRHYVVAGPTRAPMTVVFGAYIVKAPKYYWCDCDDIQCPHCAQFNEPIQEYWTMRIAIWPDGEWCNLEVVEEFMREQGMGDNYATFTAANNDEAERLAARIAAQGA